MSATNAMDWVNPQVLRALRETLGFRHEEVEQQARRLQRAHYAPITREQLENWERGSEPPELEHLETLAELYGVPLGYFFLHEPPKLILPLSYRGLASEKEGRLSPLTQQTLRRFVDLSDWIAALLEEHGITWEVKIHPVPARSLDQLVAQERERLGFSEQIRQQWQTAEDALIWWRRQIEAQGVFVFEMKLEASEVRGASRWVASRYPFILVNHQNLEAATGRLFTLLHEYAHLLVSGEGITCDFRGSEEPLANRFAANLLLPAELLREALEQADKLWFKENWSDAELDELRRPFFVSRDVVAIRLQEMGLAPTDFYLKKREQWEQRKLWWRPKTGKRLTQKERKLREFGSSGVRVFLELEKRNVLPLMDVASVMGMKVEKALEFLKWARSEALPDE